MGSQKALRFTTPLFSAEVRTGFEPAYNGFASGLKSARQSAEPCFWHVSVVDGAPERAPACTNGQENSGRTKPELGSRGAAWQLRRTADHVAGALEALEDENPAAARVLLLLALRRSDV
jgi:hypothetical protein